MVSEERELAANRRGYRDCIREEGQRHAALARTPIVGADELDRVVRETREAVFSAEQGWGAPGSEADLPPGQAAVLGEHQLAGEAPGGGAVDDHPVAGRGEAEVGPALPAVGLGDHRLPLRAAVT